MAHRGDAWCILLASTMARTRMRWSLPAIALAASAMIVAPRASHAQTSNEAVAQLRFARGRDLFNQRHFADALTEFQATVALVPSPNTRLYLARCLHELGRNAEALVEYRRAAAEAADRANTESRYAATRDAARDEASQLEPLVGRLTLHIPNPPAGLAITADGQAVPTQMVDVPTPFDPRGVRLVVRAPGHRPFEQVVTIEGGHDAELTVRLERIPGEPVAASSPPPVMTRTVTVRTGGVVRLAGFVVGGVGLVGGVIGTAVFGSMAQTRFNELQTSCSSPPCPELEPSIAQGERDRALSNASLGVGLALLVAGGVMIVVGGPHETQRTEIVPAPRAMRVVPWGATFAQGGGVAGLAAVF